MKMRVELTNDDIRKLIINELSRKLGENLNVDDIQIMVRSKQNYRDHEWERGEFWVVYDSEV